MSNALELWLVRHGETTWNASKRWQGHANVPLSALGRTQAQRLAARLEGERFDVVVSSDLARAADTAALVAQQLLGQPAVVADPRWREINVGNVSGLTTEEAEAQGMALRQGMGFDQPYPGGESGQDLAARVADALRDMLSNCMGKRALVFTHGGTIRRAIAVIAGDANPDWLLFMGRIENTSICRFLIREDGAAAMLAFNDTAHLEQNLVLV